MSEREANAIKEDDVDSALESAQYEASLRQKRKLQEVILDLIRLFVDICEKENLTYFMSGGTMLGAVRHKGFIPWDDDADFGMPRPDYDKFIATASNYLPSYCKVVTFLNTKDHLYYQAHLENIATELRSERTVRSMMQHVWIDIHPLDGLPGHIVLRIIHTIRLLYQRMMFMMSTFDETVSIYRQHRPMIERVLIWLTQTFNIESLLSRSKRYKTFDRAMRKYPYENAKYVGNLIGAYKVKEIFPKSVFGDGCMYEFEGMMLNGPQDYDTYLSQLYGDYMTPPSADEREQHYITIVRT